jgi:elongation factor G
MDRALSRFFCRETVTDSGVGDEKVIRQSGGAHVYAHVRVVARALSRGKGAIVTWNAGANIPARFAPAVVLGIQDAMNDGVLAGLEVTDIHASVENGSYHQGDSNAGAFREAAEKAMTEALRQAHPVVLEALALVTVEVPSDLVSTVERVFLVHGERANKSQSDSALPSISANLPASRVPDLMAELLEATDGRANITSAMVGFQPKLEPPGTNAQWPSFT